MKKVTMAFCFSPESVTSPQVDRRGVDCGGKRGTSATPLWGWSLRVVRCGLHSESAVGGRASLCRRTPNFRRRQTLQLVAICLLGILAFVLWNHHRAGPPPPAAVAPAEEERRQSKPTDLPSSPSVTDTQPKASVPRLGESTETAVPPEPNYDTEDFIHVPDWIPRPVNARAASAEDASLRSDGLVEGTVRFEFAGETTEAINAITAHLESAGMLPEPGGGVFSSENPSRRCEVQMAPAAGGGIMVSLTYQGIDHEKGCKCATCSGHHPNPEP
jgi:hypothetical protein